MRKTFALNTEPHVAEIGGTELLFRPEIPGAEFLDAYETVAEAQKRLAVDPSKPDTVDVDKLRELTGVLRGFLSTLMLPESVGAFEAMSLPDRVLVELLEWTMEVYGSRPPTSSTGSVAPSRRAGTSGKGGSPSRASTPARGR